MFAAPCSRRVTFVLVVSQEFGNEEEPSLKKQSRTDSTMSCSSFADLNSCLNNNATAANACAWCEARPGAQYDGCCIDNTWNSYCSCGGGSSSHGWLAAVLISVLGCILFMIAVRVCCRRRAGAGGRVSGWWIVSDSGDYNNVGGTNSAAPRPGARAADVDHIQQQQYYGSSGGYPASAVPYAHVVQAQAVPAEAYYGHQQQQQQPQTVAVIPTGYVINSGEGTA